MDEVLNRVEGAISLAEEGERVSERTMERLCDDLRQQMSHVQGPCGDYKNCAVIRDEIAIVTGEVARLRGLFTSILIGLRRGIGEDG